MGQRVLQLGCRLLASAALICAMQLGLLHVAILLGIVAMH